MMNNLGENILNVMEKSHLGDMSIHVLKKQITDIGLNLDHISEKDLPVLTHKLEDVLPFFIGEESRGVLVNINKLGSSQMHNGW